MAEEQFDLQKAIQQVKDAIIGRSFEEASQAAASAGWILRKTRDGEVRYLGTCDYRPNRINVQVDDGVITGF